MILGALLGVDHRTIARDDLGELAGSIGSRANLQKHFTASVIDAVIGHQRFPQGGAGASGLVADGSTTVSLGFLLIL
jgi:hypothetical protein